ncbi:AI-2E family transporter [Bordetella bronchiseptica]|uniref:AI-2E family transporter n=1 Tax=Bordetella bronchiseptica TaxID=518 RepID=UPI0004610206|nr:AI-2E family transporter [Bordetella bronchiseptica]KDC40710.1 PF01594 domain protein [Bordetella bronchiseptica M435/02/3]
MMQTESNPLAERFIARNLLDLAIRITLIGGLTVWCYRVAEPFIGMLLWSIILAVTLAPLHMRLTRLLGARPRLAAVVLTLATMLVLLVPGAMLTASLGDSLVNIFHHSTGRIVRIPAPPDFVIELPLIGVRLHEIWLQAMTNLQDVLKPLQPHLATAGRWLLAGMASAGLGIAVFLVSIAIAGVILVYADPAKRAAHAIGVRIAGPEQGVALAQLTAATIRAVAQGVIGVALIQAVLAGLGFLLAGVPAAGLWAIVALLICIVQLPLFLLMVPMVVYVFLNNTPTVAAVFAVWCLLVSLCDNVLKPLMLARGVDIPIPVILIGALGGVLAAGIVGLFLGSVGFGLGYVLFMQWVRQQSPAG